MRHPIHKIAVNSPELLRMPRFGAPAMISVFLIAIVGCAKFDLRRNIPWQETSDKPVRSVVAFWTEAVIERTSGPPYRGFGGRLLFYPADMSQPVKVQGTVVVYAFDEDLPPPENLKPVRKFVFTNEQLQEVYSESKLGPSYNLLIPWEEFSPQARRVSLIVRYIPESGPSVISEQVKVFLPGLDESMLAATQKPGNNQSPRLGQNTVPPAATNPPQSGGTAPTFDSPVRATNYQQVIEQPTTTNPAMNNPSTPPATSSPKENKRRMETLTLNISPRAGRAVPSQGSDRPNSVDQTKQESSPQPSQGLQSLQPSTDQSPPPETADNTASVNPQPYGQPITAAFQTNVPPSPGELIKDLSRQPPTRFAPYRPLVPEGGVSQAPIVHPQSAPSP